MSKKIIIMGKGVDYVAYKMAVTPNYTRAQYYYYYYNIVLFNI